MNRATNAYARVADTGQSPREIEATVLMRAAGRLQAICNDWASRGSELDAALTYNRKVWTVLASAATAPENPLPQADKDGLARLAVFIFERTLSVLADPAPEKLRILISINRDIAAGLRGDGASARAAA